MLSGMGNRLASLWIALAALACGDAPAPAPAPDAAAESAPPAALAKLAPGPRDAAVLEMGELGTIRIELLPELAPQTVARFRELAESGFYDGTYFHRVIPGFMIQGGDPNTKNLDPRDDGRGNAGRRVPDEFSDYPHTRGTVSMANTGYSNSSSSQFFIVHEDSPNLDGRFTVFGRVVEGMETVDAVTRLAIDEYGRYGPKDRPYPVNASIERLRIEPAGGGGDEQAARPETRTAAAAPPAPNAGPGDDPGAP
jgi:cyclophilin family peptidyl-prolyl cis-trans isomerase